MNNVVRGPVKIDEIIAGFVAFRDKRANLKRAFETADEKLKASMDRLEAALLERMNKEGVETVRAEAGTAYIQTKARATCADWTTLWAWLAENKRLDFLEKRLSSKAVQEYEEETGALPPAVNVMKEREVVVRRA